MYCPKLFEVQMMLAMKIELEGNVLFKAKTKQELVA